MILAAGRGLRMGKLTDHTPKSLLKVQGYCLVEYAIATLVEAGISDIVINVCWHADQIRQKLGTGKRYGARFQYSHESEALETGGGIFNALPLLGEAPFVVISSDIILGQSIRGMLSRATGSAYVLLVNNPDFHPQGDFSLVGTRVTLPGSPALTFANVSIFSPDFFKECTPGCFPLGPLLKKAAAAGQVTGEVLEGQWWNIGTPALLQQAEQALENGFIFS